MTVVLTPTPIATPIPIDTDMVIEVKGYTDDRFRKEDDISGDTVTVLILDPGGATYSYPVSDGKITLTAANHQTVGDAGAQVWQNGELRGRFTLPFVEKYVAS